MAKTPALLAEARDKLSQVQRLAKPVTEEQLYVCLQPLLILYKGPPDYGTTEEGEAMQVAWMQLYMDALKGHPKEALDIAVSEIVRTRKYPTWPMPGDINAAAKETTDEINLILFRLRYAVEKADQHRPAPKKTDDDVAAVRAMVNELKGPDGRIALSKDINSVVPKSNRKATADALRRIADEYQ